MKILYVEDHFEMARAVEIHLIGLGHVVDCASNADQGISRLLAATAQNAPYDLILTDVEMPGHGGPFLATQARREGFEGRIAFLTNYERAYVEGMFVSQGGLEAVAAEYWPKTEIISDIEKLKDYINAQ